MTKKFRLYQITLRVYIETLFIKKEEIEKKSSPKFLIEAMYHIKKNEINQAYKILSNAKLVNKIDLDTLFLIAKLSLQLKIEKDIIGHIVELISEKENGKFTLKQEIEFRDIITEYHKNYMV